MPQRRRNERDVFVDTSAYFAGGVSADAHHQSAVHMFRAASRDGLRLVTTPYVVAETHALLLNRAGWAPAVRFLRSVEGGSTAIVVPTHEDERRARDIIYTHTDKSYSLTDALSFAVMQRLGRTRVFTFDSDFERFGFARA
ncbi:MAG: PIN domain-containing protein [Thermoflexaceae bacterium]|nr:PIN domain-containing protein [Thermoflexaceae bacterium]